MKKIFKKNGWGRRAFALLLAAALLVGYLPSVRVQAAAGQGVADLSTAMSYKDMLGTANDGNRYAGRIWTDKSVFASNNGTELDAVWAEVTDKNGVTLNTSSAEFMTVYSALGSTTSSYSEMTVSNALDVVLVMDVSYSMDSDTTINNQRMTRLEAVANAANGLISSVLEGSNNRLAVVTYDDYADVLLPLDSYKYSENVLSVSTYGSSATTTATVTKAGSNQAETYTTSGYAQLTNLQDGINTGMQLLANASNTADRIPVVIVMTDGEANRAVSSGWYNVATSNFAGSYYNGLTPGVILSTLLNAAYMKTLIEQNYDTDATVYTIGVDLSSNSTASVVMDPAAKFVSGASGNAGTAYGWYTRWAGGEAVSERANSTNWVFSQLPADSSVTQDAVKANINYADKYYDVSSAGDTSSELEDAFDAIVEELSQAAWSPITSMTTQDGIDHDTPLTYVDFIGDYMEVKSVQAISLFGKAFAVTKGTASTPTYSVVDDKTIATTVTPYTVTGTVDNTVLGVSNIDLSTAISITVTTETPVTETTEGVYVQSGAAEQTLRVVLNNDQVLPLINHDVENTNGTITINTTNNVPLRVYYTVDVTDYVLDGAGNVIMDLVDETGTEVTFYANQYSEMNANQSLLGDAHVSAQPSEQNRYYYHQSNYPIYTSVTGNNLNWEASEYGVLYYSSTGVGIRSDTNNDKHEDLTTTDMTWATLPSGDDTQVYTLVGFTRSTADTNDGNAGEFVAYIVYTTWGQLKRDIALYDTVNGVYVNYDAVSNTCYPSDIGYALDLTAAQTAVDAYCTANGITANDLQVYLGIGSWRQSRLDNMTRVKSDATITNTVTTSYAPVLNTDAAHVGGLVVWLGNNGKVTRSASTGLKITKDVGEFKTGDTAATKFPITVTAPSALNTNAIKVIDAYGNAVPSSDYTVSGSTITVNLADGEEVTVLGLSAGNYTVAETADGYKKVISNDGAVSVTAGNVAEVTVSNDAIGYGDLLITKEIANSLGGAYSYPTGDSFDVAVKLEPAPVETSKIVVTAPNEPAFALSAATYATQTDSEGKTYATISGLTIKHGQTIKITGLPEGTVATVTESLPDTAVEAPSTGNWAQPNYASRDYSNAELKEDQDVTIHKNLESTVVIKNTWTPTSISFNVPVEVTKTYNTTDTLPAEGVTFLFQLQKYTVDASGRGQWAAVGENKSITVTAANTSTTGALSTITVGDITKPGVYNYKIVEVQGADNSITYDKTEHTFSVEVYYDNETNGLKYRVIGTHVDNAGKVNAEFTNSKATASVSIEMKKTVVNESGDPAKDTPAGFKFSLYEVAQDGTETLVDDRITNGLGTANWFLTYDKTHAGEHKYVLREDTSTLGTGWTYDTAGREFTVTVTYDSTTDTVAAQPNGANNLVFTNTYDPADGIIDVNGIPTVKKELVGGKELSSVNGDIIVEIASDHEFNNIVTSGKVNKDSSSTQYGWVQFTPNLTFDKVGTYHYYVREVVPTDAVNNVKDGITYDTSVYDMIVTVTDQGGQLVADYYFEDATTKTVTFTNRYEVTEPATLNLSGTKTLDGRAIREGEFSFMLSAYEVTTDAQGNPVDTLLRSQTVTNVASGADGVYDDIVFPSITYTSAAINHTYTYVIEEVNTGVGGVTYDTETTYTVTVKVEDNGAGGVRLYVNGDQDNEGPQYKVENLSFNNKYEAAPVSVGLTGTKTLVGRTQNANEFEYTVVDAATGNEVGTGVNDASGNINFTFTSTNSNTLRYESAGQYRYTVTEVKGGTKENGVTYDSTAYTVTVNVTDNGYGQLVAEMRVNGILNGSVAFTNHYAPDSVEVGLAGTKNYDGNLKAGQFSFGLYRAEETAANSGKYEISGDALRIVSNDKDGNFEFPKGTFVAEGKYYYIVQEILPEGYKPGDKVNGVTYDTTQYLVEVNIGHDTTTGKLTFEKADDLKITVIGGSASATLDFTNTYKAADASITIQGTKTLVGRDMEADEFHFILTDAQGNTDLASNTAAANNAAGSFAFDAIEFTAAGTYTYTVTEKWPMLEGITPVNPMDGVTYSDAKYTVTVVVKDNDMGSLVIDSVSFKNEKTEKTDTITYNEAKKDTWADEIAAFLTSNITFTNYYAISGNAAINIQGFKVLEGRDMAADEFEFTLTEITGAADKTPVVGGITDSVKNAAAKKGEKSTFAFETITYDKSDIGKHYYLVAETEGESGGITYDPTEYIVTVEVADNGVGGLKVNATLTNGADTFPAEGRDDAEAMMANKLGFGNCYTVTTDGTATFSGTKSLEGATIAGNQFSFSLYKADANFKQGDKIETVKNGADGSVVFTKLTYTAADIGTHYYVVAEDNGGKAGYTYDTSVWNVTVTVTDNGDGTLLTKTEMVKKGTTQSKKEFAFTNGYTAPVDQVVSFTVKKTVKNVGEEKLGLENFKFVLENQVDKTKIEAVTDKDGNAVFALKFTAADAGKTFAYKLYEVNTGVANVTYSATVHEVKLIVTVDAATNKLSVAALVDGKTATAELASFENIYDYTKPVPETTEPETTEPADPTVPNTGDNAQLGIWIVMLAVSVICAGAFAVRMMIPRKKGKYEK